MDTGLFSPAKYYCFSQFKNVQKCSHFAEFVQYTAVVYKQEEILSFYIAQKLSGFSHVQPRLAEENKFSPMWFNS